MEVYKKQNRIGKALTHAMLWLSLLTPMARQGNAQEQNGQGSVQQKQELSEDAHLQKLRLGDAHKIAQFWASNFGASEKQIEGKLHQNVEAYAYDTKTLNEMGADAAYDRQGTVLLRENWDENNVDVQEEIIHEDDHGLSLKNSGLVGFEMPEMMTYFNGEKRPVGSGINEGFTELFASLQAFPNGKEETSYSDYVCVATFVSEFVGIKRVAEIYANENEDGRVLVEDYRQKTGGDLEGIIRMLDENNNKLMRTAAYAVPYLKERGISYDASPTINLSEVREFLKRAKEEGKADNLFATKDFVDIYGDLVNSSDKIPEAIDKEVSGMVGRADTLEKKKDLASKLENIKKNWTLYNFKGNDKFIGIIDKYLPDLNMEIEKMEKPVSVRPFVRGQQAPDMSTGNGQATPLPPR